MPAMESETMTFACLFSAPISVSVSTFEACTLPLSPTAPLYASLPCCAALYIHSYHPSHCHAWVSALCLTFTSLQSLTSTFTYIYIYIYGVHTAVCRPSDSSTCFGLLLRCVLGAIRLPFTKHQHTHTHTHTHAVAGCLWGDECVRRVWSLEKRSIWHSVDLSVSFSHYLQHDWSTYN